ncbi:MAG: CheC, inhibitor of methylation [Oscillospiraceae bacterium]|jgi:chemotaxis protein CheC|nr:CheC, inhibitor of methylation [Oscillospiraceae bacterium]
MPLHDYSDLNAMHLDVLREIGNIGTGNAATSLASMLQKPVNISVPRINVLDYEKVAEELGGPETMIVGIMLTISGEVSGMMMFLLEKDFAHAIVNDLLGGCFQGFHELDELTISALKEIGNIMAASYVNAIAQLTGLTIDISVPSMTVDMAGAILSVPAIYFADISDKVIFIQDEFNGDAENMTSHILLIPTADSLQRIMRNLGVE